MLIDKKTLRNIFLLACGCIVLYWVLHETERFNAFYGTLKGILSPFVIGAGMAFILNVPMRAIEKWFSFIKNPNGRRAVAILVTCIVFLMVIALVFWLLIPQIIDTAKTFAASLPGFFNSVQEKVMEFFADNPDALEWIKNNIKVDHEQISGIIQEAADKIGKSVSTIITGAFSAIGTIFSVVFNSVVSIVFAIYCLARKEILACHFKKLLYAFLPERYSDYIVRVLRLTNVTFSHFLSGQFVEVIILGCMFAVSMAIFKMPYIPLVSVLIAITAFIPIVGAFIGCFFGALFILVENPTQAVAFIGLFLLLQQIEGNLIYPKVVGAHIGLPGMWVLFAVAVGGELMGISGMFLMIPLASVAYTLMGEWANARIAAKGIPSEKIIPANLVPGQAQPEAVAPEAEEPSADNQ